MSDIDDLKALLTRYDREYYVENNPSISDLEYDVLTRKYFELTGTKWMTLGQAPAPGSTRVKHLPPMLSLDKETDAAQLPAWVPAPGIYVLQPKVDGLSGAIRYGHGNPTSAGTRGDGTEGEDATAVLQQCAATLGVPLNTALTTETVHGRFEVRGEFYIPTDLFEKHFKPLGAKNPRNSAAGLVSKKSWDPLKAHLRFVAYELLDPLTGEPFHATYLDDQEALQQMGFETLPGVVFNHTEMGNFTSENLHPSFWHVPMNGPLPYEIDGVVIKHNDHAVRAELGCTDKFPRHSLAFKFSVQQAVVTIVGMEWNVGMTGACVPTYLTTPAELEGTTVQRATGHNFEFYQKMGAAIGNRVLIEKRGQIIPAVVRRVD